MINRETLSKATNLNFYLLYENNTFLSDYNLKAIVCIEILAQY